MKINITSEYGTSRKIVNGECPCVDYLMITDEDGEELVYIEIVIPEEYADVDEWEESQERTEMWERELSSVPEEYRAVAKLAVML